MKQSVPNLWKVPRARKKSRKSDTTQDVSHNGEQLGGSGGRSSTVQSVRSDDAQLRLFLSEMKGSAVCPNWQDKRNRTRADNLLDWAVRQRGRKRISQRTLNRVFGHQTNPTSAYLRAKLLVKLRGHVKHQRKAAEWQVNHGGLHQVWLQVKGVELDLKVEEKASWARLVKSCAFPFVYDEPVVGGRRYHELQLLPREFRAELWRGYHEYDLAAANVTLITQAAKSLDPNLTTHRLDKYLCNKQQFREISAKHFGVSIADMKSIIQCVISLAVFEPSDFSHAYKTLSAERFYELVHHPYFQEFRCEIMECWRTLLPKTWASGEARFRLYEVAERQVMTAIEQQLVGKTYLLQHDGFLLMEKTPIDVDVFESAILAQTGFSVSLERTTLGEDDE